MMRPLILFGGLINIPMYVYNWVMTTAQLELIGNDKPFTYLKKDPSKKNGKSEFSNPNAHEIDKAATRWKNKYDGGKKKLKLGQYVTQNKTEDNNG